MLRIFCGVELPTYSFYDLLASWLMDVILTIPLAILATLIVELPIQALYKTYLDPWLSMGVNILMSKGGNIGWNFKTVKEKKEHSGNKVEVENVEGK